LDAYVNPVAANSDGVIFAGGGEWPTTVFKSTDDGTSWTEMNAGLTTWGVLSLTINSQGYLFAGTYGGGVFRSVQSTTSVEEVSGEIPTGFALDQNYPNPFNPSTEIRYTLPQKSYVTLRIFDLLGREVAVLVSEELAAGSYSTRWDAVGFASGVYLYRLHAGEFVETRKLLLLR
jgi:hypothetical protein